MRKNLTVSLLLSLLVLLLTGILHASGSLQRLEWQTQDWRMRTYNAEKHAPDDIAIIMIDEPSLTYMSDLVGRWPWPRSVHADLIQFLAGAEPRALLFDVLFTEKQHADVDGQLNDHDMALVAETGAADFVIHAVHFDKDDQASKQPDAKVPGGFVERFSLNPASRNLVSDALLQVLPRNHAQEKIMLPITQLYESAPGIGVVYAASDADGIYRRVNLLHRYQDNVYPALSLAGLMQGADSQSIGYSTGHLKISGQSVPIAHDSTFLINHYGKFNTYSYSWIMSAKRRFEEGEMEGIQELFDELKDKIIYVGANAAAVYDLKPTPMSSVAAGVFIHASATGNILEGDFLRETGAVTTFMLTMILTLLTCFSVIFTTTLSLRIVVPMSLFVVYNISAYLFFSGNLVLDMVAPSMGIVLAWSCAYMYLTFTEGKDKRKVRKVLSQYVSPAVLAEVVDKYDDFLQAEVGTKENLTILFSDIRSFTTLSETMSGERVVEMLNIYFSRMTDAIYAHNGTVDKFIGDAIMAFWGAPIRTNGHAREAVLAAIRMIKILPEVNADLEIKGYQPLEIGIGLNSGEVVLGNIGSDKKLDYTVIGDNVNLASRLEGLTKQYGCPILFTEYTYEYIREEIPCRIVDLVRVKGKLHPIRIYAPLLMEDGESSETFSDTAGLAVLTAEGFNHYLNRQWQQAIDCYRKMPADKIQQLMIERCSAYQESQPHEDWDGVFTMKTK